MIYIILENMYYNFNNQFPCIKLTRTIRRNILSQSDIMTNKQNVHVYTYMH